VTRRVAPAVIRAVPIPIQARRQSATAASCGASTSPGMSLRERLAQPYDGRWPDLTGLVGLGLLPSHFSSRGLGPPALVEPSRRAVSFALMFGSSSHMKADR
jgi:hypothetical protein